MRLLLLLPILCTALSFRAPDCNQSGVVEATMKECAQDGYYFLKVFPAKPSGEISYVFTKGTTYMITLCTEGAGVSIKLTDQTRKVIIDTDQPGAGKTFKVTYQCSATGIYYIAFKNKDQACTACGLSFLKRT